MRLRISCVSVRCQKQSSEGFCTYDTSLSPLRITRECLVQYDIHMWLSVQPGHAREVRGCSQLHHRHQLHAEAEVGGITPAALTSSLLNLAGSH